MIHSGLIQFHEDLAPLLVDIDTITPHPDNYNNGDLDAIRTSIEINGVYRPVYAQRSSTYIVAGNHVWEACKSLGATQIPVVQLDVDDTTAYRIMVADNRIASLAEPDPALLLTVLDRINQDDSLLGTGYADRDLEALRALAQITPDYAEHAQWATLCFQVPPHLHNAFHQLTESAVGDRERFELLLRLAGWEPGD